MKICFYKIAICIIGSFSLFSCTSDKVTALNPTKQTPVNDTTVTVSYSTQIVAILTNNNCLSCHGASNAGTKLHNYANVFAKASTGKLYGSVVWDGSAQNMPVGGSKIPASDIQLIKRWVDAGAPNN